MRIFKAPNLSFSGWQCPICGTSKEEEVVLIGIAGTEEGNNIEAEQFHLSCLNLVYNKKEGVIYQVLRGEDNG